MAGWVPEAAQTDILRGRVSGFMPMAITRLCSFLRFGVGLGVIEEAG